MSDKPSIEVVKTEYADGSYCGADYGSKIRVIMRSPRAVLYTGYGVNLTSRENASQFSYGGVKKFARKFDKTIFDREDFNESLVAYFGEGAEEAVRRALDKRGMGTVLFEGGGEKLPLPSAEAARLHRDHFQRVTATRRLELEHLKTCVQCGSDLKPKTENHHLPRIPEGDNHPRTLDDCQRMSNRQVIAVHGYSSNYSKDWWPFVSWYETWDGESYQREPFCDNRCAAEYGRRAVELLEPLEVVPKA